MALKVSSTKELPEGAVRVSEEEAFNYQKNLVWKWPLESEVFCLKYGSTIMGAVAAISSALIANHFRLYFRTDYKIFSFTCVPAFGVPFYFSKTFTDMNLTKKTLLMKVNCPLCINAKLAIQQFYTSFLFPSLYAYTTFIMYADITGTFKIPSIQKDPKKFWKESFRAFKSGGKTFQIVGLIQAAMIFFLPYRQHQELCNITSKMEPKHDPEILLN